MGKFADVFARCNAAAAQQVYDKSEASGSPLPPPGDYVVAGVSLTMDTFSKGDENWPRATIKWKTLEAPGQDQSIVGKDFPERYRFNPVFEDGTSGDAGRFKALGKLLIGEEASRMSLENLADVLESILPTIKVKARITEKGGYRNLHVNGVIA